MTTDWESDEEYVGIGQLDEFLRSVERRALEIARFSTRDLDEAMDIVQDVMTAFVRRYRHKPVEQWPPLFYRALDNRIKDWHRRRQARFRWFGVPLGKRRDEDPDPVDALADSQQADPLRAGHNRDVKAALEEALGALPERQRQAFLLRSWQGLSVAETAAAMACSEGTVKTHLSRAMGMLRQLLEEFQP